MATTPIDWYAWKDQVWTSMAARFNNRPGLAPLEQYMLRSAKEKRCVECGDPGTQQQNSVIIASVKHYWMCADCHQYWSNRK